MTTVHIYYNYKKNTILNVCPLLAHKYNLIDKNKKLPYI